MKARVSARTEVPLSDVEEMEDNSRRRSLCSARSSLASKVVAECKGRINARGRD